MGKNILFSPLHWGMGHATRLMPFIDIALKNNYNVFIAANGMPLKVLKEHFPHVSFINFQSENFRYPKRKIGFGYYFVLLFKIIMGTIKEYIHVKKIVKAHDIAIIVSDNRYGMFTKRTYNILLTHQLNIILPKVLSPFQNLVQTLMYKYYKNFNKIVVPDFETQPTLAGILSENKQNTGNIFYCNPLSQLYLYKSDIKTPNFDIMVLLSGIEHARTKLENILLQQLSQTSYKVLFVRGVHDKTSALTSDKANITVVNFLTSDAVFEALTSSKLIICRSGYSTVTDLMYCRTNAILVPTPGQTEQEYLAARCKTNNWFYSTNQKHFNLESAIISSQGYKNPGMMTDFVGTEKKIRQILNESV